MNRIYALLLPFLLVACNSAPQIVSDDHMKESPIIQGLRHNIETGTKGGGNWGWILWYLPVLALALAWAWREFISKRKSTLAAKGKAPRRKRKKTTR